MSSEALVWAFRRRGLGDGARLLLLALANEADVRGRVGEVPRRELAELMEISLDTLDRRIRELEAAGVLVVTRQEIKRGSIPSNYRLPVERP